MSIDLARLRANFPPDSIEWRVQQSGKKGDKAWALVLAYVTNRAIMDRLDEICGPANWRNEYQRAPEGGILCGISIRIDGEWVTKWDGAENTDIEAVKGGLSNAMKRAAVQWGIGRYLYELEATFVNVGPKGANRIYDKKSGVEGYWDPPKLPDWALPDGKPEKPKASTPPPKLSPQKPAADKREAQRPAYISKILALATQVRASKVGEVEMTPEALQVVPMDFLEAIGKKLKEASDRYGEQTDDTAA